MLNPRPLPRVLSIVAPLYNEEDVVPFLRRRLTSVADSLPCKAEIVLVNDGSSDGTIDSLATWAEADGRVKVFNLARNFGHQAAATAGLDQAKGDAVILLDADLQDPPELINAMLNEYCRGYDVVYGRRISRAGETAFKKMTAWLFYRAMRLLIHRDLPADTGDFRLVSRRCLDAVLTMRETHRFLRGMIAWVGFPQTSVSYAREPRIAGQTKYPLWRMLHLAWTAAVSFSPTPLRLSFLLGAAVAGIGMVQACNAVVRSVLGLPLIPGWSSLIVVTCLIGGAILTSIGVLGEYVGRIFEATKERPLYVIASILLRPEQATPPALVVDAQQVQEQLAMLSGLNHED